MKTSTIIIGLLKYLVLFFLVGYLGFVLIRIARPTKEMVCTEVVIDIKNTDNMQVTREEVMALLDNNKLNPTGKKFSQIDLKQMEKVLMESTLLDSASCTRNSSSQLVIVAQSPTPMLLVMPETGENFYLSTMGKALPITHTVPNILVASGHITQQWAKDNLTTVGTELQKNPYWMEQAQQIYVDKDHKIWLVTRVTDHKIKLGDKSLMADKLKRLRQFYEKGLPQTGWNLYETIDASFKGQLVCTRKEHKKRNK